MADTFAQLGFAWHLRISRHNKDALWERTCAISFICSGRQLILSQRIEHGASDIRSACSFFFERMLQLRCQGYTKKS